MKNLTRKEMITACIEDQIKRGIIPEEQKEFQVRVRLKGDADFSKKAKAPRIPSGK